MKLPEIKQSDLRVRKGTSEKVKGVKVHKDRRHKTRSDLKKDLKKQLDSL